MGRKSQEPEICNMILDELLDIKQKKGLTFNTLFRKIKKKRGKFSFDTLSKYLNLMESDGRIIRIIDVESNRKIKPTLIFKNSEVIRIRDEKSNFKNILMDTDSKFYRFPKKELTTSDLFPQFTELIAGFLREKMNIDMDYVEPDRIVNWEILLENFDLFLVENPEIKGAIKNFNDLVLLLYLNLLELMLGTSAKENGMINFNLFFHIDLYELISSVIFSLIDKIQKEGLQLGSLFLKEIKLPKNSNISREDLLKIFLNQLPLNLREEIKTRIQKRWFDEFSVKYRQEIRI